MQFVRQLAVAAALALAFPSWERAYALDPRPLLELNLSQAYERLGRLEEAVTALERYLETAPASDPPRTSAQARLATMRARLERTAIVVRTEAEGAVVLVDGEERARTPRRDPIPVAPGTHVVEVRLAQYAPFRAEVAVAPGAVTDVDVTLERGDSDDHAIGARGRRPAAAWALLGGGGAVAITGGVLGVVGLGRARDAEFRDGDDAESARAVGLAGDVLLGIGAAAAVSGLVWALVAGPGDTADGVSVRVAPAASHHALCLTITGSF